MKNKCVYKKRTLGGNMQTGCKGEIFIYPLAVKCINLAWLYQHQSKKTLG